MFLRQIFSFTAKSHYLSLLLHFQFDGFVRIISTKINLIWVRCPAQMKFIIGYFHYIATAAQGICYFFVLVSGDLDYSRTKPQLPLLDTMLCYLSDGSWRTVTALRL